jgi:hypothetical protein
VDASKPRRVEYHETNQLAMRYEPIGLKFKKDFSHFLILKGEGWGFVKQNFLRRDCEKYFFFLTSFD